MKLTAVFMLAALLQVSAASYSQSVTLTGKKLTLKKVFESIREQTGFEFVYDPQLIKAAGTVDLRLDDVQLKQALDVCFDDLPLTYEVSYNTIIVKERPPAGMINNGTDLRNAGVAEELRINGTVLDKSTGLPLAGVTIGVQGLSAGTSTDVNGEYALTIPTGKAKLVVKLLGYEIANISVTHSGKYDIQLSPKPIQLEGAVVSTGIFKRPKENFTGVATTIKGDDLRKMSMSNVFSAIRMFDASVRLPENLANGSNPNKLPEINLRGVNNFPAQGTSGTAMSGADFKATYSTNPSQPLLILDGFEVSLQRIYDLDINRIASISILKDAAATAMYGSRAANGVIVVETKQPLPGKTQLSYSGTAFMEAPDLSVYHLLNAKDKLAVEELTGRFNSNNPVDYYNQQGILSMRKAAVASGVNTYWLSKPLRNAFGQSHSLYLEGGDDYIRYGVNGSYSNTGGVMKNSGRENYRLEMNLSYNRKNFIVKNVLSVNYNKSKNSNYGSFGDYSKLNQYWNPYDSTGHIKRFLEQFISTDGIVLTSFANPLYDATLHTVNSAEYSNFNEQLYIDWKLNKNLHLLGNANIMRQGDESDIFLPASHSSFNKETDPTLRGSYSKDNSKFTTFQGALSLDYSRLIGKNMLFATARVSGSQTSSDDVNFLVTGFPSDRLDQLEFGNGFAPDTKPGGTANVTRMVSAGASLNYTYDGKYSADLSYSLDGSSQFGYLKRTAPFYSMGVAWNIKKEALLKDVSWLNALRAGVTYGSTGSVNFPPNLGITTYKYNTTQNYQGMVGATLMGYGNPNISWQQTLKTDYHIVGAFLNSYLLVDFNYYKENTESLILDINTAPSTGVSSYKENVGALRNTGLDFSVTGFAIRNDQKNTYLSVMVNGLHNRSIISHISNSLKALNAANDKNDQKQPQSRFVEGHSPTAIWAVRSNGIDPASGKEVFIKQDGTLTYVWDPSDKVIVGDGFADLAGNIMLNLTVKGFSVVLGFNYQLNQQMYNSTLANRIENADLRYQLDERVLNGRWKKPGDVTMFRGLVSENGFSFTDATYATSRFVQDNSYLNFATATIGYTVPDIISRRWKMSNVRLALTGNDLTRWSSISIERGLDYPFARNFSFNISASF
ncbi:SusC/RagA family TonB-linked outer membrane protein [Chitinophaga sp. Cy-1792]|uniref:SusC/RagA family TonB-linked outer membrane protein n=1 Tax=Chitinophaga sp. Cy-1792 TaxID=2608339 RepID=UPI00141ED6F9|nr:SusC/RagA family TonB-linked outer membrane protein [Chitinophaga sp. Cy-1792]